MADPRINAILGAKDEASKVVTGVRGQFARFGQDAKTGFGLGAGISAFNLLSRGVGMAVDVMGDAVRMAAEEEAAIAQLTRSIAENSVGWDGNIDRIEAVIDARRALAFEDVEQRDSLRQLVAVTKDYEKALDLQRTAMDFARLKGMDLAAASTLLGKVYAGNFVGLRKMGIILDANATATDYLAEVQKRAEGQAKTYAETTQGKLVRSQDAAAEATEEFGKILTPVVDMLADASLHALPTFGAEIAGIRGEIEKLAKAFDDIDPAISEHIINALTLPARAPLEILLAHQRELIHVQGALFGSTQATATAFQMLGGSARSTGNALGGVGGAAGGTTDDIEGLSSALHSAAGGFQAARHESKLAERQWKRLKGGTDENREAIGRLEREQAKWARRYRRAIDQNNSRDMAYAAEQGARVEEELADKRLVVDELENIRSAAKDIPNKVGVTVTANTGQAMARLRAFGDAVAAAQAASGVYALGGSRTPRPKPPAGWDPPRAHGGPAAAGGTYLVGEHEPEFLTMGSRSGHVSTPRQFFGSGGRSGAVTVIHTHVYLNGREIATAVDRDLGDRWSLTRTGDSYRRAG